VQEDTEVAVTPSGVDTGAVRFQGPAAMVEGIAQGFAHPSGFWCCGIACH
jgi:hypothetical protein